MQGDYVPHTVYPDVYEILEQANEMKTEEEQVKHLLKYDCQPLRSVVRGCLDTTIVFGLPKGPVPYTACAPQNAPTNLRKESKQFGLFVEGPRMATNVIKRERLFIQLMEGIHPDDALLVQHMKDKVFPYDNIPYSVIKEAWPTLIVEYPE